MLKHDGEDVLHAMQMSTDRWKLDAVIRYTSCRRRLILGPGDLPATEPRLPKVQDVNIYVACLAHSIDYGLEEGSLLCHALLGGCQQ